MRPLIPLADERRHLGRFYLATLVAELTHLAMPFQVLLMVRYLGEEQVGWVLLVEGLVAMVAEIPTGAWADRFGRKASVLVGHAIATVGWLAIPAATFAGSSARLPLVCLAFGIVAAGHALISGAMESWVVDNLRAAGQRRLVLRFFSRERSLASIGGIAADVIVISAVGYELLDFRWFFVSTAWGELAALLILLTQHEAIHDSVPAVAPAKGVLDAEAPNAEELEELAEIEAEEAEAKALPGALETLRSASRAILGRRGLMGLALLLIWTGVTHGTLGEGIQTVFSDAHEVRDLKPHREELDFATLELGADVLGVFVPLAAEWSVAAFGARAVLGGSIVLPSLVTLLLALVGRPWQVATIYFLAVAGSHIFHVVADEYQHRLLDSYNRATVSSGFNLMRNLSEALSGALLAGLSYVMAVGPAVALMGGLALPALFCLSRRWTVADESDEDATRDDNDANH